MEVKRSLKSKNEFSKRVVPRRVEDDNEPTTEKTEIDADLLGFDLSGKLWSEQEENQYQPNYNEMKSKYPPTFYSDKRARDSDLRDRYKSSFMEMKTSKMAAGPYAEMARFKELVPARRK